jgi:NAD(P)-dependent dehydrogenase (short-subunit alcohol dehydrogenase family)
MLDLADLATVRACAHEIRSSWERLDVLVNNAGGMWSQRSTTAHGFEQTLGVNHLGHFYLTNLLLDRLIASTPARIVNVASVAHHLPVRGMRWNDLQTERRYTAMRAYSQSKLANVLFTQALARRLDPQQVTANAVHPGPVRSGFGMDGDMKGVLGRGQPDLSPVRDQRAARRPHAHLLGVGSVAGGQDRGLLGAPPSPPHEQGRP